MSARAGSTAIGLGAALRSAVGRLQRGRIVVPARRPPPFPAFAVDQGANQLALGGDIGKRREIDPQRQRLAAPPALLLIDQEHLEPIDRERIGIRRQKREHVGDRNAASQSWEKRTARRSFVFRAEFNSIAVSTPVVPVDARSA